MSNIHHRVSVIIPNYNNSRSLEQAILSCINQGPSLHEIIVVDDKSTDGSLELLRSLKDKYRNKLIYYSNPDKGGNNARNFGFSKSSGDYIQWLDADDELCSNKFRVQLNSFEEDPGTDVIYSDWYLDTYNDQSVLLQRVEKKKAAYQDFIYQILSDNWSVPANYLFKRKLAERLHVLKAWNPNTQIAQDREYVTIAALIGAKFSYTPGLYAVYNRGSENSVSKMNFKTRLKFQLIMESTFRRYILKNSYSDEDKKRYLSILNAHVMNACFYAPGLTIEYAFSFQDIEWHLIHYKKIPIVPLIYAWQHAKYFLSTYWARLIR